MEEKKDYTSFFNDVSKQQNEETMKPWNEISTIKIKIPAKIEAPRISLWDKILLHEQNIDHKTPHENHSLGDLSCFLLQVRSKFLTLLYSADTYNIYPPQEIEIVTTHRQLTESLSAGVVDVYHKGQLVVQSQWNLSRSGEKLIFEVTCPRFVSWQLAALHWKYYPQLLK